MGSQPETLCQGLPLVGAHACGCFELCSKPAQEKRSRDATACTDTSPCLVTRLSFYSGRRVPRINPAMPLTQVNELSDDEPKGAPAPQQSANIDPKPKAKPKAKGKSKSAPKPKPAPTRSGESKVSEPPTNVVKRPAASGSDPNPSPMKKPASRAPDSTAKPPKVTKYMYHKQGKWGIKVDGREQMTVGRLLCLSSVQGPMYVFVLFPCKVKPAEGVSEEKLEEIAAAALEQLLIMSCACCLNCVRRPPGKSLQKARTSWWLRTWWLPSCIWPLNGTMSGKF